jgi:hypothetical protein
VLISGIAVDETESRSKTKYSFQIIIDRTSDSEEQIIRNIEECFEQLNNAKPIDTEDLQWSAELIYQLSNSTATAAARIGIESLEKLMPLVFAFNEEVDQIVINDQPFRRKMKPLNDSIKKVSVEPRCQKSLGEVLLSTNSDISIGLILRSNTIVKPLDDVPRVFISMPLMGSERIPIPFVIESRRLEPSEKRDSLLLAGDNGLVKQNKELIQTAFTRFYDLLQFCITEERKGLQHLCYFSKVPKEYISDKEEYWKFWDETIKDAIQHILNFEVVCVGNGFKAPSEVIFPTSIMGIKDSTYNLDHEQFSLFYDIASQLKRPSPTKELAFEWQEIGRSWKQIDENLNLRFYTLEDVRDDIKTASIRDKTFLELTEVAKNLGIKHSQFMGLLKKFFGLVDGLYIGKKIIPSFVDGLLCSQNDTVMQKHFPLTDINNKQIDYTLQIEKENIPDELKDIAAKISFNIRSTLLDKSFSGFAIIKDLLEKELTCSDLIEACLKYKPPSGQKVELENERDQAWGELFIWCLKSGLIKQGLPIYTKDNTIRSIDSLNADPFLLLPFNQANLDEAYEDLIPEGRILNPWYFNAVPREEWASFKRKLLESKLCSDEVIQFTRRARIKREKLRKILIDPDLELEKKEHEILFERDVISNIPFWFEVLGRINQVPERAKKLIHFLLDYVCRRDAPWIRQLTANCSCGGTHKIIPSEWLANLKSDSWVPVPKDDDDDDQVVPREATKDTLEKLLSLEGINEIIKSPFGIDLLAHLGFDLLDLTIKRKTFTSNVPEQVLREELAKVSQRDDILKLTHYAEENIEKVLEQLRENEERQKKVEQNRTTGKIVEELITEILKEKGKGIMNIVPRYEGADIEIWPVEEGWDGGRINIGPYLMEIKFTTSNRARLSKRQANEAELTLDKFLVLVVEGNSSLKQSLLNYSELPIEDNSDLKKSIEKSSYIVPNISEKLVKVPIPDEVEPDINGYWVKKSLWAKGVRLNDWISALIGK